MQEISEVAQIEGMRESRSIESVRTMMMFFFRKKYLAFYSYGSTVG